MPVVGAVRKLAVPTSFQAKLAARRRLLRRSIQNSPARRVRSSTRQVSCGILNTTESCGTKKKGGAMNAPPLEGSDTSVSSPKRQTAEAVRNEDHLDVTVSQERSYIPVIVPWNVMAVFRYDSAPAGVENPRTAFAGATKHQSIWYRTESPRSAITRAYGSALSQNPRTARCADRPGARRLTPASPALQDLCRSIRHLARQRVAPGS